MMTQLTSHDLSLLENLRLARLKKLFVKSLGLCWLEFSEDDHTLEIHCPEPWLVDRLLEDLDSCLKAIWIILGVRYVSICFAGEEVHRAKTRSVRQQCAS
jgi:hypothetical protein